MATPSSLDGQPGPTTAQLQAPQRSRQPRELQLQRPQPLLTARYVSADNPSFALSKPLPVFPTSPPAPPPSHPPTVNAPSPRADVAADSEDTITKLAAKTSYLHALREAVLSTHEEINRELTARMGADSRARAAADGRCEAGGDANPGFGKTTSYLATEEARHEENYGEEGQGDEEN